jgi:hypothetical protein
LRFVRMSPRPVCSFDGWYQPLRHFTLHYVIILQPQDSLWHLAVSRAQNDRQAGKPLLDMTCYGFRVYAFLFVLQQNRRDRRFLSQLYRGVAARRQLDAITLRLQSSFAKLQHLWTVVDAQQSGRVHGHILLWALQG